MSGSSCGYLSRGLLDLDLPLRSLLGDLECSLRLSGLGLFDRLIIGLRGLLDGDLERDLDLDLDLDRDLDLDLERDLPLSAQSLDLLRYLRR